MYQMQGLSFREYLQLFHHISINTYSLSDILQHKIELPKDFRPLVYFTNYLKSGYYPSLWKVISMCDCNRLSTRLWSLIFLSMRT